jgi:hypothetical protein
MGRLPACVLILNALAALRYTVSLTAYASCRHEVYFCSVPPHAPDRVQQRSKIRHQSSFG